MYPHIISSNPSRVRLLLAALGVSLTILLGGCVDQSDGGERDNGSGTGTIETSSGDNRADKARERPDNSKKKDSDEDQEDEDESADDSDTTSGEVTVSWERPTTREDGSDFMASEVDYYEVAYGTESGEYTDTLDTIDTSTSINSLGAGETYYFTVRVHDTDGLASDYATEVSTTVQ